MKRFNHFTEGTVPTESKPLIEDVKSKYGFVPNIINGMSKSPETLKTYLQLSAAFEASSLSPEEREIVQLTVSRLNECGYCTSVHSMMAEKTDLEWDTIEKIRNRQPVSSERYEALRTFTEKLVEKNGAVSHDVWTAFTDAGFDERAGLDVVIGVSLKTLTNTVNHLVDTPLDQQFQKRQWSLDQASATPVATV